MGGLGFRDAEIQGFFRFRDVEIEGRGFRELGFRHVWVQGTGMSGLGVCCVGRVGFRGFGTYGARV